MGWIYWFSWAITFALELTASGLIIQYWAPDLNIGIFIGVFWLVITALNFLPVNFYGEVEFYFCTIKILTIIGFMIFGICINAGAGQHGYIGFKYWHHPGAFAPYLVTDNLALAKFVGFWAVLIQVCVEESRLSTNGLTDEYRPAFHIKAPNLSASQRVRPTIHERPSQPRYERPSTESCSSSSFPSSSSEF
jgi:amino acid transporter